jgi:small-conductance mechanosensitive channel
MDQFQIKIIETVGVIIVYLGLLFSTQNQLNNVLKKGGVQRARRKIIIKTIRFTVTLTFIILIAGIWGLQQDRIAVFAGTLFTALGIAFFAQWSLLSNITAGVILFFNHPLKLGDRIKILDKDYAIEGEITDWSYFFIHIKNDQGEVVTIPNSVILQKSIVVLETVEKENLID